MLITNYFRKFFQIAQSSGNLLIICVIVSLMIANSSLGDDFQNVLDYPIGPYSTSLWINDGLMAIFFLLVGLEIKRELIEGELSSLKNASLPIFAAIGGMVVPALIFIFLITEQNTKMDGNSYGNRYCVFSRHYFMLGKSSSFC
jgi:NhaA family Na+:H+ antiporter